MGHEKKNQNNFRYFHMLISFFEACRRAENEGFEVVYLDVDDRGIIDMTQLESEMDDEVC